MLAMLSLLLAAGLSGAAQESTRQRQPEQQEEQPIAELVVQEVGSETMRVALPRECHGITPVVQTHDVADNFNPPGSALALSPALQGFLASRGITPKGYDDARTDTVFADSFKLRTCRVCYATLEIRVKHRPGNWIKNAPNYSNDTIMLGAAPFATSQRFIGPANIWSATLPNPTSATFAASAASVTNLNSHLFQNAFVDLIGQDDTDFDSATLSVWYY